MSQNGELFVPLVVWETVSKGHMSIRYTTSVLESSTPGMLASRRVRIAGAKMDVNSSEAPSPSSLFSRSVQVLWFRLLLKPGSSEITTLIFGAGCRWLASWSFDFACWKPLMNLFPDSTTRDESEERMKGTACLVNS